MQLLADQTIVKSPLLYNADIDRGLLAMPLVQIYLKIR